MCWKQYKRLQKIPTNNTKGKIIAVIQHNQRPLQLKKKENYFFRSNQK